MAQPWKARKQRRGLASPHCCLTPFQLSEIFRMQEAGMKNSTIASELGVSPATVSRAVNKRRFT